jgi:hypothetical protein
MIHPQKMKAIKPPKGSDDSGVGITIEAQPVLRLPVQFDPERTAEMPESDEARYERLNAERLRGEGIAPEAITTGNQRAGRAGDGKHELRTPRETPEKNDSQEAPGVTIQGTATSIPDTGETRPAKKSIEEQRSTEDLTKREARSNFNQGRDDRDDREDDMEIGL